MEKKKEAQVQPIKQKTKKKKEVQLNNRKTDQTFTLKDEKLMSAAAAFYGMSRNMPQEVYINNYNKIREYSGLIGFSQLQNRRKEENNKQKKKEEIK